jgi:hypothetical protein
MTEVHQRLRRRKGGDPPADHIEPLDLADPEEVRRWLDKLESDIWDAIAAGDDATRPPGERDLGRRMAREHILEARRSLRLSSRRRGGPCRRSLSPQCGTMWAAMTSARKICATLK